MIVYVIGKDTVKLEEEIISLRSENLKLKTETDGVARLQRELQDARERIVNLTSTNDLLREGESSKNIAQSQSSLAMEVDYQFSRHKLEMESALKTIDQLKQELETARMHATSSRDQAAKAGLDSAHLRDSLKYAEVELNTLKSRLSDVAEEKEELASRFSALEKDLKSERDTSNRLEQELKFCHKALSDSRADLESYINASNGKSVQAKLNKSERQVAHPASNYFDESESTIDSVHDDGYNPVIYNGSRIASSQGLNKLGHLEKVAAESIASMIYEEVKEGMSKSNSINGMKEASVKASLRILYTISDVSDTGKDKNGIPDKRFASFASLGDRDTLAQIVAETQVLTIWYAYLALV